MGFNILNHLHSALFSFSIIVIFEIFLVLKSNKSLKVILLFYASAVLWYSAATIYCDYNGYNRFLLELPFPILGICVICLFSTFCCNKIQKHIILLSAAIILIFLFVSSFYTFIMHNDLSLPLSDVKLLGNYVIYIKLAIFSGIFISIINFYVQMNKKYEADNIYYNAIKKWSLFFIFFLLLLLIAGITKAIIGYQNLISKYLTTLAFFASMISLLFRPKFLNNATLNISLGSYFNRKKDADLTGAIFNEIFYNQLYFLNPEASMEELSKKVSVSSEALYRFIYNNYNSGFNDLVNENRVNYFIDVVKSKKHNNYTIDALAQMAGFSSRHHLYKPFKKFHGGVPSDFIKSIDHV